MKKIKYFLTLTKVGSAAFIILALSVMLSFLTTKANAQGATWAKLKEADFRRDGDDPDRFVIKDRVKNAQDSDVIHLKIERVPELKNKVEIVLAATSNVRWWKGLTIFKSIPAPQEAYGIRYVRYRHIDTQDDDKRESTGVINVADLGDYSYLVFEKAKAFGVHTEMYQFSLVDKDTKKFKYAGYRLTFTWERDG